MNDTVCQAEVRETSANFRTKERCKEKTKGHSMDYGEEISQNASIIPQALGIEKQGWLKRNLERRMYWIILTYFHVFGIRPLQMLIISFKESSGSCLRLRSLYFLLQSSVLCTLEGQFWFPAGTSVPAFRSTSEISWGAFRHVFLLADSDTELVKSLCSPNKDHLTLPIQARDS